MRNRSKTASRKDLRNNKGRNYGAVSVVLDEATERRNPLWIASDGNEVQGGGDKPECGNDCCASSKRRFKKGENLIWQDLSGN